MTDYFLLADLEKNKMTPNNQKTICVALKAPTWECAGSSAGSANPAGPPSSLTSWNWRSGLAPQRRPLSDAGSEECLRYGNYKNALSRRWTRRCWHHHQTHTSFSKACAEESMEQISRFKGSWNSYQKTNKGSSFNNLPCITQTYSKYAVDMEKPCSIKK